LAAANRKVGLTDRAIKALKPAPAGKRFIVWDAVQPHLAVRVTDKGHRTFVVIKRRPWDRNPITHIIGAYPGTSLAAAREAAPGILATLAKGQLPAEIAAATRREEQRRRKETFGAAVDEFLVTGELDGLRSGHETETLLRREFLGQIRTGGEWIDGSDPLWRDTAIASISRRDVIERLDAIKRRGGKYAARHALGAVRKFFNWCAEGERFGVDVSPCASIRDKTIGFSKDGRDLKRKRVLTDAELRDVWAAAEHLTALQRDKALAQNPDADVGHLFDPVEPLVKLLMLTGQRLNDIASARWSEIDLDKAVLTVPPERYKTGVAQELPLSLAALDIIKALPRFGRGFILTTTGGKRPIGGGSKMKARLDKAIAERRKKSGAEAMPAWVFHDLRRTVRTRLVSDLGIEAFIAERVIGHALPGLHGVYDQGSHRPQKRDALDRWAGALAVIVGHGAPLPPNLVRADEVEQRRRRKRA
jgi:integrase